MLDSITTVNKLTDYKYKNRFIVLICLLVVSAFVELLGVGILVPVVDLISDPGNLERYPLLNDHLSGRGNIVYLAIGLLVIVYAVKNVYLFMIMYYQSSMLADIQHAISTKLFSMITHAEYVDLVNENKADIINTMSAELNALVGGYVTPLIGLITELIVVTIMVSALLWYNFEVAAYVMLFTIIVSASILFFLKSRLLTWGIGRQTNSRNMIGVIDNFMTGAKEVKVYQKESYLQKNHDLFARNFVRANRNISIANAIPRYTLEMVAVLSLLFVVILVYNDQGLENILPIVVLYSAVAFRLMPGFNRIVTYINQLKYNRPCITKINSLYQNLGCPFEEKRKVSEGGDGYVISIKDLGFCHNNNERTLNGISLDIKENEKIGIIGGSGSGKTTLINLILGLIKPSTGSVTIGDCESSDVPKGVFSYVPQDVFISDATIKENIVFDAGMDEINDDLVHQSLIDAGLGCFIDANPEGVDTRLGDSGAKISGGQKQRIGIARSLYHESKIIVFDEATSALDYKTEHEVVQSIFDTVKNRTMIMVAHRISTLKYCDRIILLKGGKIVASGSYEYMTKENEEVSKIIKHGII